MTRSPRRRGECVRAFRAMNTDVTIVMVTRGRGAEADAASATVQRLFEEVERSLSRFLPDSDLSRLNRSAGHWCAVPALVAEVLGDALAFAQSTDGAFDPTVLPGLLAAGYDRSFELLAAQENTGSPTGGAAVPRYSWRDVAVAPGGRAVLLPSGCGLDFGGIGKGWTLDRAAARLRDLGLTDFALDAGGDVYAAGAQVDGTAWTVAVEDPSRPGDHLFVLAVRDGAVATSTTTRRRWRRADRTFHHLIDPRTGQPSNSGIRSVTVAAPSAARAEVLAKAALIRGPSDGLRLLEQASDSLGLLMLDNGEVRATPGVDAALKWRRGA